jgi:HSP20 family protein
MRALTRMPATAWPTALSELDALENRMNRWMGQALPRRTLADTMEWVPEVDMIDTDGEYVLTAETPGMSKDDINIDVQEGVLTLSGEKKESKQHEDAQHRYFERRYGSFERSFSLPRAVDAEKVKAEYQDGVLTIHLPKSQESRGRKVKIT